MTTDVTLYPHQREALAALVETHRRHQRILLSLPSGTGKTVVAAEYVRHEFLDHGRSVLWIAHSQELLDQAYETFVRSGVREEHIGRRYARYRDVETHGYRSLWLVNNNISRRRAERVNDFETPTSCIYCRASTVAAAWSGGLIHTAVGGVGGSGGLRTNRSGC